ncbi:unnamed protein product [Pleuronectes platessa]|uniref:Uncharacterized protein n=1 Tax=Pleuronectes platessa TaxID=8262 RepID=A0A9N7VWF1_PLEPL|nr:unnamed protein product [Pleuronectes platessa]
MYPRTPPLSSASAQCRALQPQGEAPASSPARAGQAEHLAPREGHPSPPPVHTHSATRGQGGFTHPPTLSLPSIASCLPSTRLDIPRFVGGVSQYVCVCLWEQALLCDEGGGRQSEKGRFEDERAGSDLFSALFSAPPSYRSLMEGEQQNAHPSTPHITGG